MSESKIGANTDEFILFVISLIDNLLVDLGQARVEENEDFQILEHSCGSFVALRIERKERQLRDFEIRISPAGIETRLDRVNEAYEWSADIAISEPDKFVDVLRALLLNFILVEYFGNSVTVFRLYDSNGKQTNSLRVVEGIPWPFVAESKLLLPLY